MAQPVVDEILRKLRNELLRAERMLDAFKTKYQDSPVDAFEWANDVVHAAAKQHVYMSAIAHMYHLQGQGHEELHILGLMRTIALTEILRRSGTPSQSTSPMSNLVAQYTLAAYADLYNVVLSERW